MYLMIRTLGMENVNPGDPVLVKYDAEFGRIGAFDMGGCLLGYLGEHAPSGCLDEWTVCSRIGDSRIIARAAVIMDGAMLLSTDSPVLVRNTGYSRIEREGYGILVPNF